MISSHKQSQFVSIIRARVNINTIYFISFGGKYISDPPLRVTSLEIDIIRDIEKNHQKNIVADVRVQERVSNYLLNY